jgi:hypothetical protein
MVSERSKSAAAKKKNNTSAPQKKPRLYYNKQLGNTSGEKFKHHTSKGVLTAPILKSASMASA